MCRNISGELLGNKYFFLFNQTIKLLRNSIYSLVIFQYYFPVSILMKNFIIKNKDRKVENKISYWEQSVKNMLKKCLSIWIFLYCLSIYFLMLCIVEIPQKLHI
jgi:hypothetical protein